MRSPKCLVLVFALFCPLVVQPQEKAPPSPGTTNDSGTRRDAVPQDKEQAVRVTSIPHVSVEPSKDWTDQISWVSNLLLVLVGSGATIAAFRTLSVIRRQTTAIEISAEAARLSADSLKNAERAWLLIRPEAFTLAPSNRFDWVVKNAGRTTATISAANVRCRTLAGTERLPANPEYREAIIVPNIPVSPGEVLNFWSYFETETGDLGLTDADMQGIVNRRVELVAYGYVKYADSFGEEHESRFCYHYATWCSDFRTNLSAPADYHRCT